MIRSYLLDSLRISHIQYIVTPTKTMLLTLCLPDEGLSDVAATLSIDPLFSVEKLQIHVTIEGNQDAFVLHAPLQLHNHRLVYQVNQERLWVNWNRLNTIGQEKMLLKLMP